MQNLNELKTALHSATRLFETLQIEPEIVDLLKRKETIVNHVANNLASNTFNFSVIGTMKSGKSTFVNALLGTDLMPNETEACTLVPTKVNIGKFTKKVVKHQLDGKVQTLKGANVAEQLHEDIKYQRNLLQQGQPIDVKFYETSHPLAKAYEAGKQNIVFVDTPGPNEMKLFQTSAFNLEETFLQSLYETSYLFFIIDLQYFKDEENVKLLEAIQRYRPELMENMTFIINKIDRLTTTKDVTLEQTVDDVEKTLVSWGIASPHIMAVSSKKALYSRLIGKSLNQSLFDKFKSKVWKATDELGAIQEDLQSILPMHSVEIDGEQFYKRAKPDEVYEQLLEESNFDEVEAFITEFLLPNSKTLSEDIARVQCERERQWLTQLMEQHAAVIEQEMKSVRLNPAFKQVAGLEQLAQRLNSFAINPTELGDQNIDYETIYSYLAKNSYYSGYRSALSGMSANTSWNEYRLDDYDWMDPSESSAGYEKERLYDFYEYQMNDFLSTLKQAKYSFQKECISKIEKKCNEEIKRLKSDVKKTIEQYDIDFNVYLDDTINLPVRQHFSVHKFSTPGGLYIDQKTEYKERLIFKGRGDIKYSSFRLKGVSDFKSTCKEYLELTLEAAAKETLADFEDIIDSDQPLEIERSIDHIKEQLQIKLDNFSEQKHELSEQLADLNARRQAFLDVLAPFATVVSAEAQGTGKAAVRKDEFDELFKNRDASFTYLAEVFNKGK